MDTKAMMTAIDKAISSVTRRYGWNLQPADAGDIRGDACVKVLERYTEDRGEIAGFAFTVARTVALDWLRNRGHKRIGADSVALVTSDDDGNSVSLDLVSSTPTPFQALVAKRRDAEVTRALGNLSDDERAACLDAEGSRTVAERVRKTRAIAKLQEDVKATA